MKKIIDSKLNHIKNVLHGFFLAIGTTVAEAHTILPIIVSHFGGGAIVIGLFSSLLRGGAIAVQLYAAFHAQSYPYMLKYLRRVFVARFLSWFFIGVAIIVLGDEYPTATLWCIGIGLFLFSFSAGFGAIYFREIVAKVFSHKFRGKTMATRQFFAAFASIMSGLAAGIVLEYYEAPLSYGILFIVSTFFMGFGYLAFGMIEEPIKEKVAKKEKSFRLFLINAWATLKGDKDLQVQIATFLSAYSYLFALPFIIIDAQSKIDLDGTAIGLLITVQMTGSMLSNILWGKLSSQGLNRRITQITLSTLILCIVMAFFANSLYWYLVIFFFVGTAMDGNRLASGNLILIIAPEEKRPVYTALQTNIMSFGIFFSILGGVILAATSYEVLYSFTIVCLSLSLFLSFKLRDLDSLT
ncbi:MAG: MFS transporter [Campylobacterota bacterium]|nr:MFS transporter [Campylobacterota bacterium]